jgi:integrase
MNRQRLTKRLVESITPGTVDVIVWDTAVRGFHVKVTPTGRRVYLAYYRNAAGQQRRPRIGEHGSVTVDEARAIAQELLGQVAAGKDPSAARQAARRKTTLEEFWERFADDARTRWKPSTAAAMKRLWETHLRPSLGSLPLDAITRAEVALLHQRLAKTPTDANRTLALLKSMLNRAIDWGAFEGANPTARIKPYPEKPREAFLDGQQLRALLEAIAHEEALGGRKAVRRAGEAEKGKRGGKGLKETESRGISPHAAGFFRLLIYTGARMNEVKTARWSFVDWETAALRLPDSKTGKKVVWLNSLAEAELRRLHGIRSQDEWIIEGRRHGRPLDNAQKPWRRVRIRAAEILGGESDQAKGLLALRLHDLRHSFASFAVGAGVPLMLVGKALGHAEARTTERYAHVLENPIREASEAVADRIRSILGDGGNGAT